MLAAASLNAPSAGSVNQVMIGRQLVKKHAIATVDYALQLAAGAGFYRANVSNGDFVTSRPLAITRCNLDRRPDIRVRRRLDCRLTISFDGQSAVPAIARCRSWRY